MARKLTILRAKIKKFYTPPPSALSAPRSSRLRRSTSAPTAPHPSPHIANFFAPQLLNTSSAPWRQQHLTRHPCHVLKQCSASASDGMCETAAYQLAPLFHTQHYGPFVRWNEWPFLKTTGTIVIIYRY